MSEHKSVTQHPRQLCYFCGSEGPIQTHHIVPQRYDGGDHNENLVDLCPTCHERLERLYNKSFYQALGIEKGDYVDERKSQRRPEQDMILAIIDKYSSDYENACPLQIIHNAAKNELLWEHEQTEKWLAKARNKGEVYQPKKNHYRST